MKNMNKKGFTIVELVIVIAVIAILAGVLIPTFSGIVKKANASSALQEATSTMKSTLGMSDYGTLEDGTQFVIVKNNAVTYKFNYNNNAIAAAETETDRAVPAGINTVIIHGTTVGDNTTVNAEDVKMIAVATAKEMDTKNNPSLASGKDYYEVFTYTKASGTAVDGKTYYEKKADGAFDAATGTAGADVSNYYTKDETVLKVFINTDYATDIVTLTKSN